MRYMNITDHNHEGYRQNIEMILYSAVCFFVPFFLAGPQWLVGTIVNMSLVLAAFNLKSYKLLPVIILPSIAVLSRGLIFGPFTPYLLYMMPFIWLGNLALVSIIKKFNMEMKKRRSLSLLLGIFLKVLVIFSAAFVLVSADVLPAMFLTAMGVIQLITAVSGSALAYGTQKARSSF
ncbi:MAG: hypothetical protein ACQEP1_00985 [Nanobdellota archaeon]